MQDLSGDGYFFYSEKKTIYSEYFRCIESRNGGCSARAIRRLYEQGAVSQSGYHNHPPNPLLMPYLRERQSIVDEARRLDVASLRDIFNAQGNIGGPFRDLLNPHRLGPSMLRARMDVLPPVNNLKELVVVLENPTYACVTATAMFADSVYGGSVETPTGQQVVLFITSQTKILLSCVEQLVFHTTPMNGLYWVCSVGGQVEGNFLQLSWLIMSDLNEDSLTSGLCLLRSTMLMRNFTSVLCGNDNAAVVLRDVFGVPVVHSLFDFISDLKNFVATNTEIGPQIIARSPMLRDILNECCSLPLLPPDMLQMGLNIILAESSKFTSFIHTSLITLFEHINSNWLKHPLKHEIFSIASSSRTHFQWEELKVKDLRKFHNNGDLYHATRHIVSQAEKVHTIVETILSGGRVLRGPVSFMDLDQVKVLTAQLRSPLGIPPVAVKNFLHVTAELLAHVNF